MQELRITLSDEEFDALSYVLAHAYERALEGYNSSARGSGNQVSTDEPLPTLSPEEKPFSPPSAQVIKSLEEKLIDGWFG